jgi:hypothetical protein
VHETRDAAVTLRHAPVMTVAKGALSAGRRRGPVCRAHVPSAVGHRCAASAPRRYRNRYTG